MKRFLLLFALLLYVHCRAQIIEHEWTLPLFSQGSDSKVTGISVTEFGYVYTVHSFQGNSSAGYFPNSIYSLGDEDILIVKTSANRNHVWHRQIGGVGNDIPTAMEQLSNGDLVIVGVFSDSVDFDPGPDTAWRVSQGELDNFILKVDKDGYFLDCTTFGGNGISYINDLKISQNDDIYVCGWYNDSINLSPLPEQNLHISTSGYCSYLSKFDVNLNYIESVVFDAVKVSIHNLFITENQTVLFTGTFEDTLTTHFADLVNVQVSNGGQDAVFGEISADLNFISQRSIGSVNDELGFYSAQLSNGNVIYQMNFSESFIIENGSEDVFVDGLYTYSPYQTLKILKNTLLLCLEGDSIIWNKTFSASPGNGRVYSTAPFEIDENSNIIIPFYYNGICNLGDNNFELIQDNASSGGSFILKLSKDGIIRWVRKMEAMGPGGAVIYRLKQNTNKLYLGGQFSGTIDFDPSIGIYDIYGSSDPFISVWTLLDQHLLVNAVDDEVEMNLVPNPADEKIVVSKENVTDLLIIDVSGKEIHPNYFFDGKGYQINTSELQNGTYLLVYRHSNSLITERFVVQHANY